MSRRKITGAVTMTFEGDGSVTPMVTSKKIRPQRRPFYLREWRKFMGAKPNEIAEALGIERQSYYRLEVNWWTISTGEQDIICRVIGIKPSQLWFPPPKEGQQERVSLDELLEDMPENVQIAAIAAIKAMAGK
jgi:DNA-binding XRE family transcriptional regulator